jgi:hypothetical protein
MMILILEYDGESNQSKAGILADAEALQSKLMRKKQSSVLCKTITEFSKYLSTPESKTEDKLHVVCHGNRNQVGNFNGGQLARLLWDSGLKNRANIKKISFHSCESGWESVNPENNSWTPPMIWQAAAFFSAQKRSMEVKGYTGQAITDSQGHNFVLKHGETWDAKATTTRDREVSLLKQKCEPKSALRPKYATYNGSEAYRV